MNCEDFDLLLADALGGELSDADRLAFEQHLGECPNCRKEYESTLATVSRLRSLSTAEPATMPLLAAAAPAARSWARWGAPALRYAASIMIAFAAGYGVSGMGQGREGGPELVLSRPIVAPVDQTQLASASFGAAFADTYRTRPGGSELSRCLTAMFGKRN